MKLNKHEISHKNYVKAQKELDKLYIEERKLPYRKLENPYQDGWYLKLALRDDIARSNKGPIITSILEQFGKSSYERKAKNITQIRKDPSYSNVVRILSKQKYSTNIPYVRDITESEYNNLSPEKKKYFTNIVFSKITRLNGKRESHPYEFSVPAYYLIVKVDKRIVTHVKDINPEIVKRIHELRDFLLPYWMKHSDQYQKWENYFNYRSERRESKVQLNKQLTTYPHEEV